MARKRPDNPDEDVMSFGDHIEELRRRLIYAIAGVLVAMAVTLWYGRSLIAFIYAPLAEVQRLADLPTQTYTRSSVSGFAIYMKVSLIAALIIAGPWVMYQIWRFIETGLYETERRTATILMGLSGIMTALALTFMYYVFLPAALSFFIVWTTTYPIPDTSGDGVLRWIAKRLMGVNTAALVQNATNPATTAATGPAPSSVMIVPTFEKDPESPVDGQIWYNKLLNETRQFRNGRIQIIPVTAPSMMVPLIDPNEYLGEVTMLTLAIVIIFHVPVVMAVLGLTGLIRPETLSKRRKMIIFACFIIVIIFTPQQDPFTNTVLPIVMWGLFELGLVFMRYFYNKHHRARDEAYDAGTSA